MNGKMRIVDGEVLDDGESTVAIIELLDLDGTGRVVARYYRQNDELVRL